MSEQDKNESHPKNQVVPTVVEQKQGVSKAYDIYSRLLEDRIIFLSGKITSAVANTTIAQLLFLENKTEKSDIHLYINSPGGQVSAGIAVYDAMQHVANDVNTYCVGMAGSMAAVLLLGGEKGKRYCLPHGEVLLHQVMGQAQGQADDIEIAADHILTLKKRLNKIISKHTGQPIEKVKEDTDRDYFLDAEEAKEYGIVDKVLESNKD